MIVQVKNRRRVSVLAVSAFRYISPNPTTQKIYNFIKAISDTFEYADMGKDIFIKDRNEKYLNEYADSLIQFAYLNSQ